MQFLSAPRDMFSERGHLKPNSITLPSSELASNMFGASSELAPNMFGASSELAPNQLV